jgi:High potential iron-sulfur protein
MASANLVGGGRENPMQNPKNDLSRRSFLSGVVVLPALGGLLLAQTAVADAKGSKAQFKYQATPNKGQQCSQCSLFIAGSSAKADGTCKVVDGSISPTGWCTAFAPKKS